MPIIDAPRAGLIAADDGAIRSWQNATKTNNQSLFWAIHRMMDIDICRRNHWMLLNVICLPGWETMPDAQTILEGARSLIVGATPSTVVVATDDGATLTQNGIAPSPDTAFTTDQAVVLTATRSECMQYLIEHFPTGFLPRVLDQTSLSDLRTLRGLSIRAESAALNYRNQDDSRLRAEFWTIVRRLNERYG